MIILEITRPIIKMIIRQLLYKKSIIILTNRQIIIQLNKQLFKVIILLIIPHLTCLQGSV